jgi:hypothetical protein
VTAAKVIDMALMDVASETFSGAGLFLSNKLHRSPRVKATGIANALAAAIVKTSKPAMMDRTLAGPASHMATATTQGPISRQESHFCKNETALFFMLVLQKEE